MFRNILLKTAVIAMLASCQSQPSDSELLQNACLSSLKERLKSPSSLVVISAVDQSEPVSYLDQVSDLEKELDGLDTLRTSRELTAKEGLQAARLRVKLGQANDQKYGASPSAMDYKMLIRYESANSYGASIAGYTVCEYNSVTGRIPSESDVKIDGKTTMDWLLDQF